MLGMLATSLAMIAGTALAAPNPGGNRQRDVFGGYTSTEIVVKLRPEAMATPAAQRHFRTAPHDADPRAALSDDVRAAAENWRATRMRPAYSEPFADPALAAKHGLDRTFIIEVPQGTDTAAMAAAFAGLDRDVEVAAVDGIGGVADPIPLIPNDTNFYLQYAMRNTGQTGGTPGADIDAPEAWGLHTGGFGTVTIAIIDSGVNSHPEYGTNNNLLPYPQGRIVRGINTGNGLTPDLTTDGCPHGTHVAGIAAASGNNSLGVAGVTWGAYIMPVRVLLTDNPSTPVNEGCSGFATALANGIVWAANHGAQIGNMSLQYYNLSLPDYNLLSDAVNYAHDLGMILIAAAGNNNGNGQVPPGVVAYPAKLLNCMGVSGTTDDDLFADVTATGGAWWSNYGNEVDVCAPGDRIWSTYINNSYQYLSGTSMATPHVSGLAALVKSYVPALTNVDIELILEKSADDRGPVGWDNHYGFGRINAYQALLTAAAWRGAILSSSPPGGAVDARKPTDPDGTNAYGWQVLDLTFTLYASLQTPADFTVSQAGGVGVAPPVTGVAAVDDRHTTATLDAIIGVRAWTTVQHVLSGTQVRLGYLPANVNGDRISDGNDVTALATALSGGGPSRPIWSLDIDRSEAVTPADILEAVDLLNGAGAYDEFLDATLP
jgi:subtilisin family serine protease